VPPGGGAFDECGVGDPTAHHHVGAGVERGGDAPATEVGVRADRLTGERRARVEVIEVRAQVVDAPHQVVALDVCDLHREAELGGDLAHLLGAAGGVQAARIGDHLDATLDARGQHLLHLQQERAGVAGVGVA
jgi:hypothetical protein